MRFAKDYTGVSTRRSGTGMPSTLREYFSRKQEAHILSLPCRRTPPPLSKGGALDSGDSTSADLPESLEPAGTIG